MESLLISNSLSFLKLSPSLHPPPNSFLRSPRLLIHSSSTKPPHISLSSSFSSFPQTPKTKKNFSFLNFAHKNLIFSIFLASISLLSLPNARFLPALAATTVSQKDKKHKHEFSDHAQRLLSVVSVLLRRIEDVRSGKGGMEGVRAALKEVKASRKRIQDEVIGNLNVELREMKSVVGELSKRLEELVGLARGEIKSVGNGEEVKELERKIGDFEKEYNDLLVKVEEIEDRMVRRETLTYSVAVRELSFIEKESEVLVQRFGRRMMEDARVRYCYDELLCVYVVD